MFVSRVSIASGSVSAIRSLVSFTVDVSGSTVSFVSPPVSSTGTAIVHTVSI